MSKNGKNFRVNKMRTKRGQQKSIGPLDWLLSWANVAGLPQKKRREKGN